MLTTQKVAVFGLLALAAFIYPKGAFANIDETHRAMSTPEIVAQAKKSVVTIKVCNSANPENGISGTGFFVKPCSGVTPSFSAGR